MSVQPVPPPPCNPKKWQVVGPEKIDHEIRTTTVWKEPEQTAFFFKGKMAIDADGSPHAYNPSNTGLDGNSSGKDENGNWVGIVLVQGRPWIQGPHDPAPGYYVSQTSLEDETVTEATNPRRYVNAEEIPYIALPPKVAHQPGHCVRDAKACLGDIVFMFNNNNGKFSFAIVADIGPGNKIGEGSIKLADALGIPSSPRTGGVNDGVYYLVFPGSGNEKPKTTGEIDSIGMQYLNTWGGRERLIACLKDLHR